MCILHIRQMNCKEFDKSSICKNDLRVSKISILFRLCTCNYTSKLNVIQLASIISGSRSTTRGAFNQLKIVGQR